MTDRRDLLLERVYAILQGLAGQQIGTGPVVQAANIVRNRGEMPTDKRPAIILMDADETSNKEAFGRGRPGSTPLLVEVRPEIYVCLEGRKPQNLSVGEDLNAFRIAILKLVLFDSQLATIIGSPTGEIRYEGCLTDLARGRNEDGELGMMIAFRYPFIPTEL